MDTVTFRAKTDNRNAENVELSLKVEQPVCRICFDVETGTNLLISPCKCSGSIKFVHEECLKIWILASNQDIKSCACELCRLQFTMSIKVKRVCACDNLKDESFKLFILPLVSFLIGTVFAVIIIYLIRGIQNNSLNTEEKTYFALVIFACVTIIMTLLYIIVKTIIVGCCTTKITDWSIESLKDQQIDETQEINHQTELSHREEGINEIQLENSSIVVVPNFARYRGRAVVVPQIDPAALNRVNREAAVLSRRHTSRSYQNSDRNHIEHILTERLSELN